jgi:hypothetical protein
MTRSPSDRRIRTVFLAFAERGSPSDRIYLMNILKLTVTELAKQTWAFPATVTPSLRKRRRRMEVTALRRGLPLSTVRSNRLTLYFGSLASRAALSSPDCEIESTRRSPRRTDLAL